MDNATQTAAREQGLMKLMAKNMDAASYDRLTTTFSFGEFQALQDPSLPLPESLPALSPANRQAIAAAIKAGPPKRESGGGKGGGAPRFVPDPQYDGRALQLAAAITERVPFGNDVHRRQNLVSDIRALLRAADKATDLPADKVAATVKELTEARVTLDAKIELAKEVVVQDPRGPKARIFRRSQFLKYAGERNPDGRHPLTYKHRSVKEDYDRPYHPSKFHT